MNSGNIKNRNKKRMDMKMASSFVSSMTADSARETGLALQSGIPFDYVPPPSDAMLLTATLLPYSSLDRWGENWDSV